jgi:hypothetical protein
MGMDVLPSPSGRLARAAMHLWRPAPVPPEVRARSRPPRPISRPAPVPPRDAWYSRGGRPALDSLECSSHVPSQFVVGGRTSLWTGDHQVSTWSEALVSGDLGDCCPQTTAHLVPLHRRTDTASHRVGHPRGLRCGIGMNRISLWGQVHHGQRAVPGTHAVPAERVEGSSLADTPDQADRRLRPRWRRARMIRRPALVDMRWRNPWRRARRLTLG